MGTAELMGSAEDPASRRFDELVQAINPKLSPAFSANLFKWLQKHGRAGDTVYRFGEGELSAIYRAGTLFIGQPYNDYHNDTAFSGALLMSVLCVGKSATRWCYPGYALELSAIESFWDRYCTVGRCAIDPDHRIGFVDDAKRYVMGNHQHTCSWCKAPVLRMP